jgi:hypothetical protein
MRWKLPALALLLAACGQSPAPGSGGTPPVPPVFGIVYLAPTSNGAAISVVDAASGRPLRALPAGTPAPDWRWLYAVTGHVVQVVDPATGTIAAQASVPDWAAAVRTSADGRWLVFTESMAPGSTTSRFQVRDAALAKPPETVTLNGYFSFDGISNDGRRLYLLEWLRPGRYQVRRYDLPQRELYAAPIVDKAEGGGPMSGEGAASATTRDGATQLTLYQHDANHRSFVHVLPMTMTSGMPFAFCVDLPGPDQGWTLVAAPTGDTFYAVNPSSGGIVRITPNPYSAPIVTTGRFSQTVGRHVQATQTITPAAVVSRDGSTLYLAGGPEVVSVSTSSMRRSGRYAGDGSPVMSLALGAGGLLYALEPSRLLALEPRGLGLARSVTLQPRAGSGTIIRVA